MRIERHLESTSGGFILFIAILRDFPLGCPRIYLIQKKESIEVKL